MSTTSSQNKTSLSKRVAWLTLANVASFAISFLAPLIVVRLLDQTQFGTYKQVFQILATMLGMLYLQIPPSIYYFWEREPEKRLQIALNVILLYLTIGTLVAVFFSVYPNWASHVFQNADIASYIPLLGVTLMFWLASNNLEAIPISNNDVRLASILIIFGQITRSLLVIGSALVFRSTKAILYASMLAGAMQLMTILTYIHLKLGSLWRHPRYLFDWPIFKKQIANSLPYAGGGFSANVQTDMHNYFVSYYFSPATFAIYANGCFQIPLLTLLQSAFREAITPDVARLGATGDYKAMRHAWLNAMRKLSLIIFPAFALMFVMRFELITTLFTKAYADSVPIFAIYLINILFLAFIISPYVRMFPEFRLFFFNFQLLLVPITGLALYLSIHKAGLIGVVSATVAIQAFTMCVYLHKISHRIGVARQDLKLLAPVASIILAAAAAAAGTSLLKASVAFLHPILLLALCGSIFGIIYVAVALLCGALTPHEKAEIRAQLLSIRQRLRPSAPLSFSPDALVKGVEKAKSEIAVE